MKTENIHPYFPEEEFQKLKTEFEQLNTIEEKYSFWENKLKCSYVFWGLRLINGSSSNFEIIPSNNVEADKLIKLILSDGIRIFWKRNDIQITSMKEHFIRQFEDAPDKEIVIDYEQKKIDDIVLAKRQTNRYDDINKYEKDSFFVRGFETYLLHKIEFNHRRIEYAGYLLVEYYKGLQLAKYREFVTNYKKADKKKQTIKLTGEQKFLILHYLGFGSEIKANTNKSILFDLFITELKSGSIRPMFSDIRKYETEENLNTIIDLFRLLKLDLKARELEDILDKLRKKR